MRRHRVNIYKITRECGVRLRDASEHSPASRRPGDCFCKPTIREIGESHGEAHLRLVLMLLTGDRSNARELYADVLKAVSRLLAKHPELVRRPTLIDEFNALNIHRLRRQAKAMNCDTAMSDVLHVMLTLTFILPDEAAFGEAA
ncbi:hypothetical protein M0654_03610 [Rhizobium sp. NTR19]|uniref:Uncharacterized protein n=1 Tax=Neorhizobium turbinariae TaxID=2937795 RepID=A0ABT0IMI7_9HYPH|nr:hypothetical protein [Neorhizobium turbinariae]MCK8779066.1 hypothetical protein [Neorhizobium turbinariae]